jgi:hypothetical protein
MLSEYHQSNPACTLTTHPPQVTFCFDVEFQPAYVDVFLLVPVTKGAVTVDGVASDVPFLLKSSADTTFEVGKELKGPPVLFVPNAAFRPAVPTNGGLGVASAASRIEVELSPPNVGRSVGLDSGAGPVPKEAGDRSGVPAGTDAEKLGFGR